MSDTTDPRWTKSAPTPAPVPENPVDIVPEAQPDPLDFPTQAFPDEDE
jgi:hypothetical protein